MSTKLFSDVFSVQKKCRMVDISNQIKKFFGKVLAVYDHQERWQGGPGGTFGTGSECF